MKQGWLIVNGYLESEKFDEIYSWLIDAAEKNDGADRHGKSPMELRPI